MTSSQSHPLSSSSLPFLDLPPLSSKLLLQCKERLMQVDPLLSFRIAHYVVSRRAAYSYHPRRPELTTKSDDF